MFIKIKFLIPICKLDFPVHTVNRCFAVYINTVACYYNVDLANAGVSSGFGPGPLQINSVDPRGLSPQAIPAPLT